MTAAQAHLERPVAFRTAAKKLAAVRGDEGREGGWIYSAAGTPICHGWEAYGQRAAAAGMICQDAEHNGGNGKWYVWVIGLRASELARAEALFGKVA